MSTEIGLESRTRENDTDRPTGPCSEAQVNPPVSGGIQPWFFRLSGLADIAHRTMYTSRTPVQRILVQPALFPAPALQVGL